VEHARPISDLFPIALPPRRPVRCTSGARGRHCTTGCGAGSGAASCCGSRTPTASAPPGERRADPRGPALAGLDWDRPDLPGVARRQHAAASELLDSGPLPRSGDGRRSEGLQREHAPTRLPGHPDKDPGAAVRRCTSRRRRHRGRDLIRGPVAFPNRSQTILVIARATGRCSTTSRSQSTTPRWGSPTSCCNDHLSNTPKQLLGCARWAPEPRYAHLPLLHNGKKISKRHGPPRRGVARRGYLPEAVRNYLALLGWGYDR